MQILVIAATATEIQPFITNNSKADVLICGVGVPSTIYHLHKRILQVEYDLVIQAGIAGGFDKNIALAKTVMVTQDIFADIGFEEKENYISIFNTDLANKDEPPFEDGWLMNPNAFLNDTGLQKVKAITVNKVSDSALQKKQFANTFGADIETMEGAALHYVCLQEDIPFLQLRSISNYLGERDKTKWMMKEAIENLNSELSKLITN